MEGLVTDSLGLKLKPAQDLVMQKVVVLMLVRQVTLSCLPTLYPHCVCLARSADWAGSVCLAGCSCGCGLLVLLQEEEQTKGDCREIFN